MPLRAKLLEHEGMPWLVLVCMLFATVLVWQFSEYQTEQRKKDYFLYLANKNANLVVTRMQAYTQVLRGGAALFASSENVNREEWRTYVQELALDESLPGILGTGYVKVIPPNLREAHQQEIQSQGFPDYKAPPLGDRELVTSIIYLEPFNQRNKRAFGFDMFSEPVRRAAMIKARDTGKATLSGKVTLVQESTEDIQPGFLMYLPVYQNNTLHDDIQSRRKHLIGFVYSPFRAHDLMDGLNNSCGGQLTLELFDGEPIAENYLYRCNDMIESSRYKIDIRLDIAGRPWTARLRNGVNFETNIPVLPSYLILAAGIGANLAIFGVLLVSSRSKRDMRVATEKLKESHDSYRTLVENVPGTVFRSQVTPPWVLDTISADIEKLTGHPPEYYLVPEQSFRPFIEPRDEALVTNKIKTAISERQPYSVEYQITTHSGDVRWVNERGRANYNSTGDAISVDGVILDITNRKKAELRIRELAFYDSLTKLPNRRLLLDRLSQHISSSSRSKQVDALLFIDIDNFKTINDSLGHKAGDTLLTEIASRLLATVRENDTVARIGGDEFVVLLDNLSNDKEDALKFALQIGQKLIDTINQPFLLENKVTECTTSIGITSFSGQGASVDELLRQADHAMYEAKSAGRNCLKVYKQS